MQQNQKNFSAGGSLMLCAVLLSGVVMEMGFLYHSSWYLVLLFTVPALLLSIYIFKRRQF